MVTKKYTGSDLDRVRAAIEQDCGANASVLSFHYSKPRGLRRLFFGPRVEVVVELSATEPQPPPQEERHVPHKQDQPD